MKEEDDTRRGAPNCFRVLVRCWSRRFAVLVSLMVVSVGAVLFATTRARGCGPRSVDSSNLRQVGQSALIYASENKNFMPGSVARDVWHFAELAAREGGLNYGAFWMVGADPAVQSSLGEVSTVLTPDGARLDPAFRRLKPSLAVALGENITANSASDTPIVWTRGLQLDGTWAPHSPYAGAGGYVFFLGGNVAFYRNVKSALVRFDGAGVTSNILEALPPGSRVSEYRPTDAEVSRWARVRFWLVVKPLLPWLAWLCAGVVLLIQAMRGRWAFLWFVCYLLTTLGGLGIMTYLKANLR